MFLSLVLSNRLFYFTKRLLKKQKIHIINKKIIKGQSSACITKTFAILAREVPVKILDIEALADTVRICKREGKSIVHCHGCFDLMHPGHIKYFQASKKMGDVLVVTVTPDIYVDKGSGRPAFNQNLRVESIAALECVDYVAINKWRTAEETLRLLLPNIYVKGQEFQNLIDRTGKIQKEYAVVEEIGAEMRFTEEVVFSSTELLNRFFR